MPYSNILPKLSWLLCLSAGCSTNITLLPLNRLCFQVHLWTDTNFSYTHFVELVTKENKLSYAICTIGLLKNYLELLSYKETHLLKHFLLILFHSSQLQRRNCWIGWEPLQLTANSHLHSNLTTDRFPSYVASWHSFFICVLPQSYYPSKMLFSIPESSSSKFVFKIGRHIWTL